MEERTYTTHELTEVMHVSEWTLRKYIRNGKLKATKIGRQYLIKEKDVRSFLEKGTTTENEQ